jgi:trehalose 6-phosphate synthase
MSDMLDYRTHQGPLHPPDHRRHTPDRVVVLANRAPFRHDHSSRDLLTVTRTASGLVTALEPLLETRGGTWVAHAFGNADALVGGRRGGLSVSSGRVRYRLRYVPLPKDEHHGFYHGYANQGLWPLCHDVGVPSVFRAADLRMYRAANARFAAAVAEESGDSPLVFVQDYHFALVPRIVAALRPASTIAAFWHVPWPSPDMLASCPAGHEIIDGLLGSHLVGLQTEEDRANFLKCAASLPGVRIEANRGVVHYRGGATLVRPYPVGVEWHNRAVDSAPPVVACREEVRRQLQLPADARIVVGIDRLDYTKGLEEKVDAVECLLERRPEFRGRVVLVQVAEPSRSALPAYKDARARLVSAADRVNQRFGTATYRPVVVVERHCEQEEVYRFYRAADVCYVGSLRDGMNLVAKEFVCAREDGRGVLVLSAHAGASRQLPDALSIDPRAVTECADTLAVALTMGEEEQGQRMTRLRLAVRSRDARWWADRLLADADDVARERTIPPDIWALATARPA